MTITSPKNPLLQEIRHAAAAGRPTEEGCVVAEGPHLVEEALRSAWTIELLVATPRARDRYSDLLSRIDAALTEVSERALASASATETSQGILALLRPQRWHWRDLLQGRTMLVVLDGIQDPGNAGAIVRSAEAFGATGVVLGTGSVRVANGKFLRASAGSIFRVPFIEAVHWEDIVRETATADLALYALSPRGDDSLADVDLTRKCTLIVGSEGAGVSAEIAASARRVSIPATRVESLNAAVAASIALFEAHRQRTSR
jgi:RNA methyltransferase, TrmH family